MESMPSFLAKYSSSSTLRFPNALSLRASSKKILVSVAAVVSLLVICQLIQVIVDERGLR